MNVEKPDTIPSGITYSVEPGVSPQEVAELYRSAELRRPVDDLPRIGRMLAEADLILCARHDGQLVGIARSLTDWSYCCYLSDLAVHADYQRQGIGRELTVRVQAAVGSECMVLLLAAPQARDYYARIGFDKAENAWILPRRS